MSNGPAVPSVKELLAEKLHASIAAASARIAEADARAHASQVAFAAGKFQEHFKKTLEDAKRRIEDEFGRVAAGSQAAGRDSEAGG